MNDQAGADYVRIENFYSGNVQGVGFRYTVSQIAERYAVTGFVRNLPDGRVQLVADGKKAEVERFLREVSETMAEYIASTEATPNSPPTGDEYQNFSIRH